MKKLIIALAVASAVGVARADLFASLGVDYGITASNTDNGGLVDNILGKQIMVQVIAGGGDGLGFTGGKFQYNKDTSSFLMAGNDTLIESFVFSITDTGADAFQDQGLGILSLVGGNGTAWADDTFIVASGIEDGNQVFSVAQAFINDDYSDAKKLPQAVKFGLEGSAADPSTTVQVIPEPATVGLLGVAGLGLFLARRKARS